ncbi:MAG: hypothetical protein Q4D27_00485 [Coriobacteriia bacterium]|nr:hypothetical protein [Coriobacteriia bacterium]
MSIYLGPTSSLELMRYLRSVNAEEGLGGTIVRKRSLNDAEGTIRHLKELDVTAQLWLNHVSKPIHVFVGDKDQTAHSSQLVTHVFAQKIPHGAFLNLGHDICICSPQFTFMQLAAELDTVELIAIGMELCGSYSKWRMKPDRMFDPYFFEHDETRACTFDLPPAMKKSQLNSFINRLKGYRGVVGARAAARWVLDCSASPMETATCLLLCLPKRLGGYGLPQPVLNPKLTISNPDGVKERYPDLYWPGPNIDVEYNSDAAHSGDWSRYRDSKREVEFVVANVRVLPLTRPQLFNAEEFDAFAQGLRRMLDIRARKADADWHSRHIELRNRLLAGWER